MGGVVRVQRLQVRGLGYYAHCACSYHRPLLLLLWLWLFLLLLRSCIQIHSLRRQHAMGLAGVARTPTTAGYAQQGCFCLAKDPYHPRVQVKKMKYVRLAYILPLHRPTCQNRNSWLQNPKINPQLPMFNQTMLQCFGILRGKSDFFFICETQPEVWWQISRK